MAQQEDGALRRAIGAQIRALRLRRGLTLREAAARCGVSFAMLGTIEKNGQNTTLDRLEQIVRGLGGELALYPLDTDVVALAAEGSAEYNQLGDRTQVGLRFLRILPRIPTEEIDVFVHELALWERRYGGD